MNPTSPAPYLLIVAVLVFGALALPLAAQDPEPLPPPGGPGAITIRAGFQGDERLDWALDLLLDMEWSGVVYSETAWSEGIYESELPETHQELYDLLRAQVTLSALAACPRCGKAKDETNPAHRPGCALEAALEGGVVIESGALGGSFRLEDGEFSTDPIRFQK